MEFSTVAAFPFEQIGFVLRKLSSWSRWGNGIAVMLCAGICLAPIVPVAVRWKDRDKRPEHIMLIVLSGVLFGVIYCMINPGILQGMIPADISISEEIIKVLKAVLGMVVWSVVVCYVVLRLLRLFRAGTKAQLYAYLQKLLYVLCILFTAVIVMSGVGELITGLQEAQRGADRGMALVRMFVTALPYGVDIVITLSALRLLKELLSDSRSEQVVLQAKRMSQCCYVGLILVTASGVVCNLLQLILMRGLSDVNVKVTIPLMSLAFVLVALLFSRLVEENKKLADDNEMFI